MESGVNEKGSGFGGKYLHIPHELRAKLRAPMPPDSIKQHPTKTYLSTIKAIYVAERLNDVFGVNGWDMEHEVVEVFKNEQDKPHYVLMAGRIYLREFDLYTSWQYGGHELLGKGTEPADGFKSAVTDAMSKCASYLEIGIQVFKGLGHKIDESDKRIAASVTPAQSEANVAGLVSKPKHDPVPPTEKPVKPKKTEPEPETQIQPEPEPVKVAVEKEDEKPAQPKKTIDLRYFRERVNTYKDAKKLLGDAHSLVEEATGILSDDEIAELKDVINVKYKSLKK
jgi:hypothetical protein